MLTDDINDVINDLDDACPQREGGLMTWSDYPYCVGTGACSPCAPEGYR